MKKKTTAFFVICLLCLGITACGKNADSEPAGTDVTTAKESADLVTESTDLATPEVSPSKALATEDIPETARIPEIKEKEMNSDSKEMNSDSKEINSDSEVFAQYFENGEIDNNGGYFVRAGSKVYYRLYSTKAIEKTMIWGKGYLDADDPEEPSDLMCYDMDTGDIEKKCTVYGSGRLYAVPEGLYLTSGSAAEKTAVLYDPETGSSRQLGSGSPVGVSDDGKLLVVTGYRNADSYDKQFFDIYKDGRVVSTIEAGESERFEYCGISEHHTILLKFDHSNVSCALLSIDEAGNQALLGEIPLTDTENSYSVYPEFLQFLRDEGKIYISLGFFEGTGHFFSYQIIVSAIPGVEGSAEVSNTDNPDEAYSGEEPLKIYLTGSGEIGMSNVMPGEIGLSESYYGDLVYYDSPFSAFKLEEGFVAKRDDSDNEDANIMIQDAVAIRDTAFIVDAVCQRNHEADIGWREAYDINWLRFIAMPIRENGAEDTVKLGDLGPDSWKEEDE